MEPMYKRYAETKPLAVFPMNNFGGLEILDVVGATTDYAVACFNWGNGRQKIRKHIISTSPSGRTYIRKYGVRYYLDQMMRV